MSAFRDTPLLGFRAWHLRMLPIAVARKHFQYRSAFTELIGAFHSSSFLITADAVGQEGPIAKRLMGHSSPNELLQYHYPVGRTAASLVVPFHSGPPDLHIQIAVSRSHGAMYALPDRPRFIAFFLSRASIGRRPYLEK